MEWEKGDGRLYGRVESIRREERKWGIFESKEGEEKATSWMIVE